MKFLPAGIFGIVIIGATVLLGMMAIPIISRPGPVSSADLEACQHYDNQTIVSKIVYVRTDAKDDFRDFSEVQDAAQKAQLLVDVDNAYFSDNVWMVPFSQRRDSAGTQKGIALLDCTRDNVEFSGN